MKPIKGLSMDHKKLEQPEGTYPFGKNGVWNANTNSLQNEKGFALSSATIPGTVMGVVDSDTYPIIFSTDGTNSFIGLYNSDLDTYEPKINDTLAAYKLGFDVSYPIKGEARRNYKNNLEVAWIDKKASVRFADLDNPPTNLDNYKLLPEFKSPTIERQMTNGGTLILGAYFITTRYINSDGTVTRYGTPSSPIFAVAQNFSAIPGTSTGKTLRITLTDIDSRYEQVQVAIIKRVNGVTTVVELPPVSYSTSITVSYSGTEGEDITLEEVLIPAAFYNNAGAITQLNDVLYLADIQEAQILNMQKYASLVKIRWQSQFIENLEASDDVRSGKIRTFKHGEVYAMYISYQLNNGQWTDAFHIPGPAPTGSDEGINALATAQGFTAKNFQVDTVGMVGITGADNSGFTGVYVNQNEKYPTGANRKDFDSTDIGGEDLRGKAVRHHKMPTITQVRNTFYTNQASYGSKGLDALGILAENIIIPPSLIGTITGYEVFYAKRDYANSTMLSQGLAIYGATSGFTGSDIYFTGGNYNARMLRSTRASTEPKRELFISPKIFKLHHPDLMVNKPAIVPTFLASNLRLKAVIGMSRVTADTVDELNMVSDYLAQGSVAASIYAIRGIKDTGYILNNGSKGLIKNIKSEDGYVGSFYGTNFGINVEYAIRGGRQTVGNSAAPPYEEAHLVDAVVVKDDLYSTFNNQDLVRTDIVNSLDISKPKKFSYNGDCFLVVHSYWSYGLADSLDRFPSQPPLIDNLRDKETDSYTDEFYLGTSGIKVARRYVTESTINMWQRYVDPAMPTSKFWPAVNADLLNGMNRNRDNNSIAVSREASSIGDLLNGRKVYDFTQINIQRDPYKVIRSQLQSSEGKINSWKNFNALDYYLTDRNMGPIVNLQGYEDRLIIHHKNALYVTQDKTTLQGDILSVTLGSGDIFRMKPQQGKASKTGYAGTQHQLACMLTDYGYIFPDAETGIWFVLNGQGLNEMNLGIYNFLKEYLKIKETNPFIGNGICVGYDTELKRVLVTVKNIAIINDVNYKPNYQETPEFFAELIPGVSIVYREGRYQRFLGENRSAFSCPVIPPPTVPNYIYLIDENLPSGTVVGTVVATGTGILAYTILSGNVDNAFAIGSGSGIIVVTNQAALDYALRTTFTLIVKVSDTFGNSVNSTVTINLRKVNRPPVTEDVEVTVDEGLPVDTALLTVTGTDPKSLPLTYSILNQSVPGAIKIEPSTGIVRINTAGAFSYDVNQVITGQVSVSNGALSVISNIKINLLAIDIIYDSKWVAGEYVCEKAPLIKDFEFDMNPNFHPEFIVQKAPGYTFVGKKNVDTDHYSMDLHWIEINSSGVGPGVYHTALPSFPGDPYMDTYIGKIRDPEFYPTANLPINGYGCYGKVLRGYIDTSGRFYITEAELRSITSWNPNDPRFVMRSYYNTYNSEFANPGVGTLNTGYVITSKIKKVSNDSFESPLDLNNRRTDGPRASGLPQEVELIDVTDPRYKVLDYALCPINTFNSAAFSGTATKNDCAPGKLGSSVTYSVPAGAYTSTIDQASADLKAQQDVNNNKQAHANTVGTCSCVLDITLDIVRTAPGKASVTVTPVNGAGPFTYLWSNGQVVQTATNLDINTEYSVQVIDTANGCTVTKAITPNVEIISGLKIELMYFNKPTSNPLDKYANRLGQIGTHSCNRARFEVFANSASQGIANLNNAGGGNIPDGTIDDGNRAPEYPNYSDPDTTDRYWSKVFTKADALGLVAPDGKIVFSLVYTGIDNSPHSDSAWLRVTKDTGEIILSTTLDILTTFTFDPYE